jgi:putative transposon-encoded protein
MGIFVKTPKLRNKDAILYFEKRYTTLGNSYIIHIFSKV